MERYFEIGDVVANAVSGVVGVVDDFYTPRASVYTEPIEYTIVITETGHKYSAPTETWYLNTDQYESDVSEYNNGLRSYYKKRERMEEY